MDPNKQWFNPNIENVKLNTIQKIHLHSFKIKLYVKKKKKNVYATISFDTSGLEL